MELLKPLIIGWSIVWGFCLIAFSNIKFQNGDHLAVSLFFNFGRLAQIIVFPTFCFSVWLIGCVLIYLVCVLAYWFDPDF